MKNILIQEDDPDIKDLLLERSVASALTPLLATDTLEAYQLIVSHDLVGLIIDCTTPYMNRLELLFELRKINPQVPVVITSASYFEFKADSATCVLHKPYDVDFLFEFFRDCL
jgi:DNA-binding response OmpR family regulator